MRNSRPLEAMRARAGMPSKSAVDHFYPLARPCTNSRLPAQSGLTDASELIRCDNTIPNEPQGADQRLLTFI